MKTPNSVLINQAIIKLRLTTIKYKQAEVKIKLSLKVKKSNAKIWLCETYINDWLMDNPKKKLPLNLHFETAYFKIKKINYRLT